MKLFEKIKVGKEREIRVLGVPILQYGKDENLNIKNYIQIFYFESLEKKIIKQILSQVPPIYQDIYFLRSGLGEAYLINFFIEALCKKNKSKNPCLCSTRPLNKEWECFNKLPLVTVKIQSEALKILKKKCYSFNNRKLYLYLPLINIHKIVKSHKIDKTSHVDKVLKFCGLKREDLKNIDIKISENFIKEFNKDPLSRKNYVFVSKEAISTLPLSENFWNKLFKALQEKNIFIVENNKKYTISEAIYIASKAKSIIAFRSGFSEGLSKVGVEMFVLYTPLKFPYLDTHTFMNAYSLKKYPFVNSKIIHEYNLDYNEDDIINQIVKGVEKNVSIS